MLLLPANATRLSQPQERPLTLNRRTPLGAVLDAVWLGNDLEGRAIGRKLVAAPPSGTILNPGMAGKALYTSTPATASTLSIPNTGGFPYLQVALGYFENASDNWYLAGLKGNSGSDFSRILLYSGAAVAVYANFGGSGAWLPLTVPGGVSSGQLLCVIFQAFSPSDYRLYCNGVQANASVTLGTFGGMDEVYAPAHYLKGGVYLTGFGFGRSLTDAQALQITCSPQMLWDIFKGTERRIFLPAGGASAALAGNAAGAATGSGTLTTAIPLVGAAATAATASGALTTAIPLAGGAAAVSVANGVLTTTISLSGAALAQVAGGGALSTQIRLSGAALMQALGSADLTTSPPGLAGDAAASGSASGQLTTAIKLAGAASALAIGSGGLTTSIKLAGAAAAACNATGSLLVSIQLSASAVAQAAAVGSLSTQIRLSAAAVMQALASATLYSAVSPGLLADPRYRSCGHRRAYLAGGAARSFRSTGRDAA